MAYEGDRVTYCPVTRYDFANTYAVVVSGSGPNFCGHQILNLGGLYFHVAGVHAEPLMMTDVGYQRYLKETRKKELQRYRVMVRDHDAAMFKLEQLLSRKWRWGGLPNNCATFVEEIVQAGGSSAGLYFNCPTVERFR